MGKRGSGLTHIRYGHVTRPTELALVCPRCAALALARQPAHALRASIGDCSPEWGQPWSIVCTGCTFRATELDWKTMRRTAPLFFVTEAAGVELWAWNEAHLGLLIHVLEGGDAAEHPLGYFTSYMHKEWLKKTRRSAFAKAARRMLDGLRDGRPQPAK
jgi:hypothetical protein